MLPLQRIKSTNNISAHLCCMMIYKSFKIIKTNSLTHLAQYSGGFTNLRFQIIPMIVGRESRNINKCFQWGFSNVFFYTLKVFHSTFRCTEMFHDTKFASSVGFSSSASPLNVRCTQGTNWRVNYYKLSQANR